MIYFNALKTDRCALKDFSKTAQIHFSTLLIAKQSQVNRYFWISFSTINNRQGWTASLQLKDKLGKEFA